MASFEPISEDFLGNPLDFDNGDGQSYDDFTLDGAVSNAVSVPFIASISTVYAVQLPQINVPFIASVTVVDALTVAIVTRARLSQEAVEVARSGSAKARISQQAVEVLRKTPTTTNAAVSQIVVEVLRSFDETHLPFISSVTAVHNLTLEAQFALPFIASVTVVHAPQVVANVVDPPFIASRTRVFGVFSIFSDLVGSGPGNGGESFLIRLAPNATTVTATLTATLGSTGTLLLLSGDAGLPATEPFCLTVGAEVLYVSRVSAGTYRVRSRALSNTLAASHAAGASATWTDSYDMAIVSAADIASDFTADIASSGSLNYPGWLICFDSTQAYESGSRYPLHVTEVVGVFDAGAGATGTNRLDASQPNAVATPAALSDDCPAALSVPARISSGIAIGDVALVRYTNPESTALDLGARSAALESWFGLKRVDATDHDVTFTDPTGNVVDGSVNGEWFDPLGPGIAPSTGLPTTHDVPYTSVTLPGTDRVFTFGPPRYSERGWPICALAVRQGARRIPRWASFDWHDFNYVYSGFGTDATFCQLLINRNGIVNGSVPEVALPGPQDIDGPDAVWDDGDYYFGAAWYVVIFNGPYLVGGPSLNGAIPVLSPGPDSPIPTIVFGPGPTFTPGITTPSAPVVEGGSGGDISPGPNGVGLLSWART